ncbi:hypothetical protein DPEC_G00358710 [Dallia pectoralis]|uniref:Uncharacterized protein n=1 Tax=Dallia pectoralis TaxID=75939 RepID=A0ACC2F0A6_DALPE|nr:hypothetical protein DPEC_G00358710 [Dallia pectoralis]
MLSHAPDMFLLGPQDRTKTTLPASKMAPCGLHEAAPLTVSARRHVIRGDRPLVISMLLRLKVPSIRNEAASQVSLYFPTRRPKAPRGPDRSECAVWKRPEMMAWCYGGILEES